MKRNLKRAIVGVAAAIVVEIVSWAGYVLYVVDQSERTQHAGYTLCVVLIDFVESNDRWPESWHEFASMELIQHEHAMFHGPADIDEIRARVQVDFDLSLEEVVANPEAAMEPIGPYYEGYDRFLVDGMNQRRQAAQ